MNEYRKKLKTQNILFFIGALPLIAVQVLAKVGVISPIASDTHFADFWNGFIAGVAAGLTLIFIIGIVINLRAMRNEDRLKKLYRKETDERTKLISVKGKSAGATIYSLCMVVAAIISGYFSITVFFTIIACTFALSLFIFGASLYFSKKM